MKHLRTLTRLSGFGSRALLSSSNLFIGHDRAFTIIVEGNIASGKTETLNYFSRCNELSIIREPIERWRNVEKSGENVFQKFYSDPSRWCMPFQSYVQLTMLQTHLESLKHPLSMMERSLYSARHCFVENLRRKGIMSKVEFHILDGWYREMEKMVPVDLILYLRIDPEVCLERIKTRGRIEERDISLEYLRDLHDLHEEWLIRPKHPHLKKTKVKVIEGDRSMAEMHRILEKEMNYILHTTQAHS